MGRVRALALLSMAPLVASSATGELVLTLAPVRTSINVQNQPVAIVVSGTVSGPAVAHDPAPFRLAVTADLSDLQQNITAVLASQLNRSDKCGEHLTIERASLVPHAPGAVLTVNLHYEKWSCAKAFGKDIVKRLVGGNGVVEVRLTPVVEANRTVRLQSEIGSIQADGSLGELLRSGSLGTTLREKIRSTLAAAIEKTNFEATIPEALQPVAAIHEARFADEGGRLCLSLTGEVNISAQQLRTLIDQHKVSH